MEAMLEEAGDEEKQEEVMETLEGKEEVMESLEEMGGRKGNMESWKSGRLKSCWHVQKIIAGLSDLGNY